MKGSPGYYDSCRKRDNDYFDFWNEIKRNQHYCSKDLRDALDNYYANKTNTIRDKPDEKYLEAELILIQKIEERYNELLKQ